MCETILKVVGISKSYSMGNPGSFSGELTRWLDSKTNKRHDGNNFWALKDIHFELKKGDCLAVTGENGAGKSTLLKILSRITAPSSGIIYGKGKITSMLEVGAGFHPELSGIENIYLNGAMLGMSKLDVKAKIDEIVAFADIAEYATMPVKRYSSGMYMRLAFSTASHLQSEIMIMDEVLAVGDAVFRKKCLEKMKELNHDFGKTILLVSHDSVSINSLCQKELRLEKGMMV